MNEVKTFDFSEMNHDSSAKAQEADVQMNKEAGTALVVVDLDRQQVMKMFAEEGGLDPIIEKIKVRVESEVYDVTTAEGRAHIGSVARQIGSAKKRMEEAALELTEGWRQKTNSVNKEKKRMVEEMDALRDKVLAPREEFERREKERVLAREDRIAQINALTVFVEPHSVSADEYRSRLKMVDELRDFDWMEFGNKAHDAAVQTITVLDNALAARIKADEEAAELDRLRREDEARKQKERDEEIARQAAEKAKHEAEVEAKRKAYEQYAKAKAEQERLQKEKDAADARAAQAEQDRRESLRNAVFKMAELAKVPEHSHSSLLQSRIDSINGIYDRDWQEFKGQADEVFTVTKTNLGFLHRKAVEKEADDKRKADEAERQRIEQAERDRIAAEQKKKDDAEAARAADEAHRRKINSEALKALMTLDGTTQFLTEDQSVAIVTAIVKGKIPHVSIKY